MARGGPFGREPWPAHQHERPVLAVTHTELVQYEPGQYLGRPVSTLKTTPPRRFAEILLYGTNLLLVQARRPAGALFVVPASSPPDSSLASHPWMVLSEYPICALMAASVLPFFLWMAAWSMLLDLPGRSSLCISLNSVSGTPGKYAYPSFTILAIGMGVWGQKRDLYIPVDSMIAELPSYSDLCSEYYAPVNRMSGGCRTNILPTMYAGRLVKSEERRINEWRGSRKIMGSVLPTEEICYDLGLVSVYVHGAAMVFWMDQMTDKGGQG